MQQTLRLSFQIIRENKMADIFTQNTEGGRGGVGASTLAGNSATAEETFKIQIGISKINNFTFKCYIFFQKLIE
jgi:hypothetical protein